MTLAEVEPETTETPKGGDDVAHMVCDWEVQHSIAICGTDVSGQPCIDYVPPLEDQCIVCQDLLPLHQEACPDYTHCYIRDSEREMA